MVQDQRRQVLKTALAAASVAAVPAGWLLSETTGAEPYDVTQQPIIDTHQHLILRDRVGYGWTADIPALATGDFTEADYAGLTAGKVVVGHVFMETGVDDAV